MFLIKLHIEISILILITVVGFLITCKEQIKKNGWFDDNETKKDIRVFFIFFIPILNILILLVLLMMIFKTKEEFEEIKKGDLKDENNRF